MARELGPDRIRVNAVSPGSMLIPGRRGDRMRREEPPAYENFAGAELPSGAPVTPHEVARTVVFLLSDWATGVSGATCPWTGPRTRPRRTATEPRSPQAAAPSTTRDRRSKSCTRGSSRRDVSRPRKSRQGLDGPFAVHTAERVERDGGRGDRLVQTVLLEVGRRGGRTG
ncbi:SDR family oxidoreductase [Streptomyces stelliscabiei]|uniref:SDR family oxidoreductase n=1 Tax=Streptomyces stelliscabiei TaxID=146820 RepID=UPI00303DB020